MSNFYEEHRALATIEMRASVSSEIFRESSYAPVAVRIIRRTQLKVNNQDLPLYVTALHFSVSPPEPT